MRRVAQLGRDSKDAPGFMAAMAAIALPSPKAAGEALEWNAASAGWLGECRDHPDVMVRNLALDIWTTD
jgi:hypothetical protein